MIKYALWFRSLGLKLAVLALLALPSLATAQYFTDTQVGDVNVGFRKTGTFQEAYELVVYVGNISNYLAMPVGTSTNINFYTNALATMCPDGYAHLQWSVFSAFTAALGPMTNSTGIWPLETCWYTDPRTNNNIQNLPIPRLSYSGGGELQSYMLGVSGGAYQISKAVNAGNTNADNNSFLVLEPQNYNTADMLTANIGESGNTTFGNFNVLSFSVENVTSNSFTSPAISDFFVNVPAADSRHPSVDPLTGLSAGNADYLGYFTLNPNGTMSFTRQASAVPPTVSSVTASATNGFGPLTVVFSDSTSGSATNWVWNFGNGVIITNTTAGNVTNIYTLAGSYTVTLTVHGPGGSSTDTIANFIVTSPAPKISLMTSSGQMVFSGVNCPAGVQYRILNSTNILTQLANWKPVYTNTFSSNGTFSYTNTVGSGKSSFFIMVSP